MIRILKYDISEPGDVTLRMPQGARILTVQGQGTHAFLWALVEDTAPEVERMLCVVATGEPANLVSANGAYVGTYQIAFASIFVGHVFDMGEKKS